MFIYENDNLINIPKNTNKITAQKNISRNKRNASRRIETKLVDSYICTYLIDSKGNKILLKKVPAFDSLLQRELKTRMNSFGRGNLETSMNLGSNYMNDFNKTELLMRSAMLNMNLKSIL